MIILVGGEQKELKAVRDGIDYTEDLLASYDELKKDNDGNCIMSNDDFEWWDNMVDMLNEMYQLTNKLDDDAMAEYDAVDFGSLDLIDDTQARLDWLKLHVANIAKNG